MGMTRAMAGHDDRARGDMPRDERPEHAPIEDLSTDEVLRLGQVQLESSREVLDLLDDALRKGAEIVSSPSPVDADGRPLGVDGRYRSDWITPQDSWRS